jgi:ABC-2 type transport system permease protein
VIRGAADTISKLAIAQLKIYTRDRQSVFFALFFPLIFMLALGFGVDRAPEPLDVGVVPASQADTPPALLAALQKQELLNVSVDSEADARRGLDEGERDLVLLLPATADAQLRAAEPIPVTVLVNAAQPQRTQQALTLLNGMLGRIEHDVRRTRPLFALRVEDVEARNARYVDFLIPGLLAFMVLQLSIAGSGFNIVEYKRKGILKRLFVTPLRPVQFIASLIATRLAIIVAQISVLLLVAHVVFDVTIQGNLALLYAFVIAGGILFLSIGFALGGIAKTQSAIMALGNLVIFPQIFLAGVFFPLDSLPSWLRPVALVLPLNFVSDALRRVGSEGAALSDLGIDALGLAAWTVVGVLLAVRLFHWSDVASGGPRPR